MKIYKFNSSKKKPKIDASLGINVITFNVGF